MYFNGYEPEKPTTVEGKCYMYSDSIYIDVVICITKHLCSYICTYIYTYIYTLTAMNRKNQPQ